MLLFVACGTRCAWCHALQASAIAMLAAAITPRSRRCQRGVVGARGLSEAGLGSLKRDTTRVFIARNRRLKLQDRPGARAASSPRWSIYKMRPIGLEYKFA